MDQGQSDLQHLREELAGDDRLAWVRAVAGPEDSGKRKLLFAQITIGPQPESWSSSSWLYEQCVFCADSIPLSEIVEILKPEAESLLSVGGVDTYVELAGGSFQWFRKPSMAIYEEIQLPWPTVLYRPNFISRNLNAPAAFLVGEGGTPTFPLFSAAFGAFFLDDFRVTATRNPQLGELSICLVDQRGWIERVDQHNKRLAITLGGSGLAGCVLEFNSVGHHQILRPIEPGQAIVELPSVDLPADAWVWLKRGPDWLDYRNLQKWGGYVSPDVIVGSEGEEMALGRSPRGGTLAPSGTAAWLRKRATEYAKRAMTEYVRTNYHDFFLFAGLGIELALKSRLAEENAAFLAPDGRFAAAITLSNASEDVARLPSGTRTISGRVALDRFVQVHPSANWLSNGIAELLMHRNGEAHLGAIDVTLQRRAFNSFLKGFNVVLDPDLEEFWSPHYEFVRATLDDNTQQVRQVVTFKISQARERYSQIESLPPEQREAILAIVVSQISDHTLDEAPVECPACKSTAVAIGTNEVEFDQPDFDKNGPVGGRIRLNFTPESLTCVVCGLLLENPEELFHAGIQGSWENEDDDVIAAYRERESELWEYVDYDLSADGDGAGEES